MSNYLVHKDHKCIDKKMGKNGKWIYYYYKKPFKQNNIVGGVNTSNNNPKGGVGNNKTADKGSIGGGITVSKAAREKLIRQNSQKESEIQKERDKHRIKRGEEYVKKNFLENIADDLSLAARLAKVKRRKWETKVNKFYNESKKQG